MGTLDDIRKLLDQGLTYYGLGKVTEALQAWNRVLELDPDNDKAKEYLNFVQQNWGPPPRESEPEPYRPDEGSDGSGQIQVPPIPEPASSKLAPSLPEAKPPEPASGSPDDAGNEYSAPVKPVVESSGWGDLYDFGTVGKGWESNKATPTPDATPTPAPASLPPHPEPVVQPEPVRSPPLELQPEPQPVLEPLQAPQPEPLPEPQLEIEPEPKPGVQSEGQPWSAFADDPPSLVGGTAPLDLESPSGDPGGGALDLVVEVPSSTPEPVQTADSSKVESEVDAWLRGARDLLELDDFSGALELLDKVLEKEPNHQEAGQLHDQAEKQLLSMLTSKLGDLSQVPRVQMPEDEIIWLNYDHRAGFVLSLVDGTLSYDEIISISGLSQLECMRFLVQFLLEKVIKVV